MTAQPTPQEKSHMLDLVQEVRDIVANAEMLSRSKRNKAANRLQEIKQEMQKFRRMYPFD